MNKKVIYTFLILILIGGIFVVLAKGDSSDRNPTSADNAPPGSSHNLPVPKAVSEVKKFVANDEGISEGLVIVMTAYEKTWTNGCLNLAEPDEMCIEVLVQGYEVSVQGSGEIRVFHTNEDGSHIRESK